MSLPPGSKRGTHYRRLSDVDPLGLNNNLPRPNIISKLCSAVLDYWSLLLLESSWPPGSNHGPTMLHAVSSLPSRPSGLSTSVGSTEESTKQDHRQVNWDLVRFEFSDERDRLCLWRFAFADEDLNRLVCHASILSRSVLELLIGIAEFLLSVAQLLDHTVTKGTGDGLSHIRQESVALTDMVAEGKRLVRIVPKSSDGNMHTINEAYDDEQSALSLITHDSPQDMLGSLKDDISRLQRLSFPIMLALNEMREQVGGFEHRSCVVIEENNGKVV